MLAEEMTEETRKVDLSRVRALVLAGGASSRFFPVNKVFADPTGSGRTLIQATLDRVTRSLEVGSWATFLAPAQFYVLGGEATRALFEAQLELPKGNILSEPARRSTWPAVLYALAHLRREDTDLTVALLTSDHVIGDIGAFREDLAEAARIAQSARAIVTFGIPPTNDPAAWTGFGAIRSSEATEGGSGRIDRFEEKPSRTRAERMILEGGWSWNSGMFVFRISVVEALLERLQPALVGAYRRLVAAVEAGDVEEARSAFLAFPSRIPHPEESQRLVDHSIDFALMMPLASNPPEGFSGVVRPARFAWKDIGTWDALREVCAPDAEGNVCVGSVEARATRGCILVAEPGVDLVCEGLEGLVVIAAANGWTLVVAERLASDLKRLVAEIEQRPASRHAFLEAPGCRATGDEGRTAFFGAAGVEVARTGGRAVARSLKGDGAEGGVGAEARWWQTLAEEPQALVPGFQGYAWGGSALRRLLGARAPSAPGPIAEVWLTSPHPDLSVALERAPVRLCELIARQPDTLGPWARRLFGDALPIFLKLVSTRFRPCVHVGFRADAVIGGAPIGTEAFREGLIELLAREQELLRAYRGLLSHEALSSASVFQELVALYESWAVDQAADRWARTERDAPFARGLERFVRPEMAGEGLLDLVRKLRENRAQIVRLFVEVDLTAEEGRLLLGRAGTAHAIFGLSHQSHPRDASGEALGVLIADLRALVARGAVEEELTEVAAGALPALERLRRENEAPPKNEAWIPIRLGEDGLVIEPQQTSNTTYSWLDLYTPLQWRDGQAVFRKGDPITGISLEDLRGHVMRLSLEPGDLGATRFEPTELPVEGSGERVRLHCVIDDPRACPWFTVHRARFDGEPGRVARLSCAPPRGAFQQVIVAQGEVTLRAAGGSLLRLPPASAAFVPAGVSGYELESSGAADVFFLAVPTPWPASPARGKAPA